MTQRFLRGEDDDFDYQAVDLNEDWDDRVQEDRDKEERWFTEEEPRWILDDAKPAGDDHRDGENDDLGLVQRRAQGETGIQDF